VSNNGHIVISDGTLGYKKNPDVVVLKNINLDFKGGDFVGLVGLNGTGKSTLLKTICGLLPPLGGRILIDNERIGDLSLNEMAKKVAVVLTEKIGGFNMTVYDVVASGQIPYTDAFHRLQEIHKKAIDNAIQACGITGIAEKQLTELSDGMFQKAVIAKALAQQTPVILLDEPSAFLDYASKHMLFKLLQMLSGEERKVVILSSHDLDLVLKYCNKICVVSGNTTETIDVSEAKKNKGFMEIAGGYL
jgi:iron complex transport system ATP-binding protein